MKSQAILFIAAITILAVVFGFKHNEKYSIASSEYQELTEKYLGHIANFEWQQSFELLSDDVVFKLPNGDTGTRTVFEGKEDVKAFWNGYLAQSGNDKLAMKDFVHIPVNINQYDELIGNTGVFNLCYFSAALTYGAKVANVRMHWAFHFDDDKKIDGIYAYFDRTPIIEAADKNFLKIEDVIKSVNGEEVVQIVRIKSGLSEENLMKTAKERAEKFKQIPGLIQKYYLKFDEEGMYSGLYIWENKAALLAFQKSELAATIPSAYEMKEKPSVEVAEMLFQLRE